MDNIKPVDAIETMVVAGATKGVLPAKDLLIRSALAGAILAFATSLAVVGTVQTGVPLVGALIFPVGFAMIILLGLELGTGSFALVPVAALDGKFGLRTVLGNLGWVLLGNLLGSLLYAVLLWASLTDCGHGQDTTGVAAKLIAIAQGKTLAYAKFGAAGWLTAFIKGIICNWMVCLGVALPMTTTSTSGKVLAAWLPIFAFFAQGFEHSIVNMFVIPAAMLFGANISIADWFVWNQIPVTLGNLIGGMVFTGLALYYTYRKAPGRPVSRATADKILAQPDVATP
ncbi:MAG TPA: formate/nitrite transporter family protein [Chthoniobacterales bacterium]